MEYPSETPTRPPPRSILLKSSLLPEKIYVCLYDHLSKNNSYELEFKCGDLLYIMNQDGKDFYIGRQLKFPLNNHYQSPLGFVYKDYITHAYEKTK